MIHRAIGIDLGTSNSVMARMHGGEPKAIPNSMAELLTPSALGLGKRGELLIGRTARNRVYDPNTILSIKRFMGLPFKHELVQKALEKVTYQVSEGPGGIVLAHFNGQTYTPQEISAIILHKLRQDAEAYIGERVGRAVITVPAYFSESQVAATLEAGRMAGFTVMRIVREPTAAAMAFGLDRSIDLGEAAGVATVLVYDLGGGTFDISLLSMVQGVFAVEAVGGNKFLGGDDFDYEIMQELYRCAFAREDLSTNLAARRILKSKSEEVKILLSNLEIAEANIPAVDGINIEEEISRERFNELIASMVEETIQLSHDTVRSKSLALDLVDFILLVGGSTLVPLVQQRLRKEFGESRVRKNVDPMLCVALGAAIYTSLIDEIVCPNPECQQDGNPTQNPVSASECQRCGASLVGTETVTCPACFIPTDPHAAACWKCGSSLKERARVALPPGQWKCPQCGYPTNPESNNICQGCGTERDAGGMKCANCGSLNPPGLKSCSTCGEMLVVGVDVIPEDIGIELQSGEMAVIIPKNTNYPTQQDYSRDSKIPTDNARELEVRVWQGPHPQADRNDFCGSVVLELPPGLPKGSPVVIALELDESSNIQLHVALRQFPERHVKARFLRIGSGNTENLLRRDELVKRANLAVERLANMPEASRVKALTEEITARGRQVSTSELDQFEQELKSLESRFVIINILFFAELLRQSPRRFFVQQDKQTVGRQADSIQAAMARGQFDEAQRLANELTNNYGFFFDLVYLDQLRYNDLLSHELRDRIGDALGKAEQALDQSSLQYHLGQAQGLWPQITQELGIGRPSDKPE